MNDKLLQLKSQEDNKEINVYPYTKAKAILFDNGKTLEEQLINHNHELASASNDGFISKEDYLKLLNIDYNANKYMHPKTHDSSEIVHKDKLLSEVLDNIDQPSAPHTCHVDNIITTENKMFVSQEEKNMYIDKYTREESDNRYELKGEGNNPSISGDINVNSITIGNRFKLAVNNDGDLNIVNINTNVSIAILTADGALIVANEIEEKA